MNVILHIASNKDWEEAKDLGEYKTDSLKIQGFIHNSTMDQVIDVANYLFKGRDDLVLLVIDAEKVKAEIKYEDGGNGKLYPHIYGPLNLDAVIKILDFKPNTKGEFELPQEAFLSILKS